MKCNECLLGAPQEICWQESCPKRKDKRKQEETWQALIQSLLQEMRKKSFKKRDINE